jgi:hypothetical protein
MKRILPAFCFFLLTAGSLRPSAGQSLQTRRPRGHRQSMLTRSRFSGGGKDLAGTRRASGRPPLRRQGNFAVAACSP